MIMRFGFTNCGVELDGLILLNFKISVVSNHILKFRFIYA